MFDELINRKKDIWSDAIGAALLPLDFKKQEYDTMREMIAWQEDPIGWIHIKLGVPMETIIWSMNEEYETYKWDGTPDPIQKALLCLTPSNCKHVAIESATGVGKTFFAACVGLWFLACFRNSKVFTLAPKEEQMRVGLWAEISKLFPRFKQMYPSATLTDLRIRMQGTDAWGMFGYSVSYRAGEEVSGNIRGQHAPHMLHIFEEANVIAKPVWEAVFNTQTAKHNLCFAIWNPDSVNDTAHQFMVTHPNTEGIRLSGYDHPNVVKKDDTFIPGAVTLESLESRKLKYGEDNPIFLSRAKGICPIQATNALIRLEWIYAARDRAKDPEQREALRKAGKKALGVDVANSDNGDKAAICRGEGALCIEVVDFQCPDASILGVDVYNEAKEQGIEAKHIGVDGVGVGSSTVNKMRELGMDPQNLMGHQIDTGDAARFSSLRAQMYWALRESLRLGEIGLPDDIDLFAEIMIPKATQTGDNIKVQDKASIRELLGRSPNKADALVYWNWVRIHRINLKEKKGGIRFL